MNRDLQFLGVTLNGLLSDYLVSRSSPEAIRTVACAKVRSAGDEIIKYAAEHQIDLIVYGITDHLGISRCLLGSHGETMMFLAAGI